MERRWVRTLLPAVVLALGMLGTVGLAGPATASPRVAEHAVTATGLTCRAGVRTAYSDSDQYGSYVVMSGQIVCSRTADLIVVYVHGFRDGHLVENPAPATCRRTTACTAFVSFDNPAGTQTFVGQFYGVGSIMGPPTQQAEVGGFAVEYRG